MTATCDFLMLKRPFLLRQMLLLLLLLTNISQTQLLDVERPFESTANCTRSENDDIILAVLAESQFKSTDNCTCSENEAVIDAESSLKSSANCPFESTANCTRSENDDIIIAVNPFKSTVNCTCSENKGAESPLNSTVYCPFESNANCTCNENEDIIDADCPHFSLRLQPGEAVAVRCNDDALELPNLNYTEPTVRFVNCPLPNNSYGDLFRSDDTSNCSVMLSIRHLKSSERISADHFTGLTELTGLDLAFNNLTLLPDNLIENVTLITWLDLSHNFISVLSPKFFENSAVLERLYLNNNELSDLSESIFMNLSSLWYLNLRKNYINYVNSSTFIGLSNLRYIDLSQNQIQLLKTGTFQQSKLLKFIDLSENYFKRFFSTVFFGLKELSHIRIDGNIKVYNMSEDSEWIPGREKELELSNYLLANHPQLQYISVSNSGLDVLPRFLVMKSKGVLELHFRRNALTTVPRFMLQDCTQLKVLDLGDNAIDDLPRDLFSELETLRILKLDHNQLSKLPHSYTVYDDLEEIHLHNNTFEWLPNWLMRQLRDSKNLRVVTLSENPWRCDCRLRDLAVFLRSRKNHVVLDKQNVICVDGRRVMDLTDEILCGFTYVN